VCKFGQHISFSGKCVVATPLIVVELIIKIRIDPCLSFLD
jgi:hypothetical protein